MARGRKEKKLINRREREEEEEDEGWEVEPYGKL